MQTTRGAPRGASPPRPLDKLRASYERRATYRAERIDRFTREAAEARERGDLSAAAQAAEAAATDRQLAEREAEELRRPSRPPPRSTWVS